MEFIGRPPSDGDPIRFGVVNLPEATVFSGIRVRAAFFSDPNSVWEWNWPDDDRPIVGQLEAEGSRPPIAVVAADFDAEIGQDVLMTSQGSRDDFGIARYDWDFGDGSTLPDGPPSLTKTYTTPGTYNVTLTVTDDDELSDSDATSVRITEKSTPPSANAGGPYTGTPNVAVNFDGSASSDPEGGPLTYEWDFGDGNVGTGEKPSHTYTDNRLYNVTLTVTDSDGESAGAGTNAQISFGAAPPTAFAGRGFAIALTGQTIGFDGTGSSDPDGDPLTYNWDFGDGNTGAGQLDYHIYEAPGTYVVTLTVSDGKSEDTDTTGAVIDPNTQTPTADAGGPYTGTPGAAVTFDGSGSSDPDGNIASYGWSFGDGKFGDGEIVDHTYSSPGSYTVKLTVTDNEDRTATDSTQVQITGGNELPTADAGQGILGKVGDAKNFDGSGSSDPDGNIVSWDWDFGDGTTGTGENPSHTYTVAGDYVVTLTVTDDDSATDTDDTSASIDANNVPPVSDANGPYTGIVGTSVSFDGTLSDDPDGSIVAWDWDFGDGQIASGEQVSHTYTTAGTYDVSLTVTDDGSFTNQSWTTAAIDSANAPPVADAGGPYGGKVDVPVAFDGSGSSDPDPDGSIFQYDWDFGDGNVGTGATPSHAYATTGVYDVVLTVTDNAEATAKSATQAIIGDGINLPPTADAGGPYFEDQGVAVVFDGSASDDAEPDAPIAQYDWDFGDGNTGTGVSPVNTYAAAGLYLVTLTVTDDGDSTDSTTTVAVIGQANQPPTADAGGPYDGTVGAPVLLNGSSSVDADGTLASAQWDLGDSSTEDGLYAVHAYTAPGLYTATLTVTDDEGDTDQSTAMVLIGAGNQPPAADPNGPYTGVVDVPVTFDGTASLDLDGVITGFDWAFGDGQTGTGPTPENTYGFGEGGLYSVILQVTDNGELTASESTLADIGVFSLRPTADAQGPYAGRVGVAVTFDATASDDPDGRIARYDWDFGDGNKTFDGGPLAINTYAVSGSYIVKLTVTDDSREVATAVTTANIGIGNLPPVADAGASITGRAGREITFNGAGSTDPDGVIASYAWEFGDGNSSTVPIRARTARAVDGSRVVHVYDKPGTYFVTLTVTDGDRTPASDVTLAVVEPNQPPVCTQAHPSRKRLWPPNHRFVTIGIEDVTDPDGDPVTITIDSIFQDEPVDGKADGKTAPDGKGVGTSDARVRAERSGRGNGRVYHIGFTAKDDLGDTCSGEVQVQVPKRRFRPAIDDGALYDSTVKPQSDCKTKDCNPKYSWWEYFRHILSWFKRAG